MNKQTKYNIEDSNVALIGSDLDKKIREAAARTEPAWTNAGKQPGLAVWRIEKFNVKSIPQSTYGTFYSGDSYIVLNTYKQPKTEKLLYDVHFWLGTYTTQDEAGTAAYKTVELDDLLGGLPVQHREVQGYESNLFLSYFNNQIRILEGGIESGFKHVKPEEYKPRLLQLKGKSKVRVIQVPLERAALNSGDVFILDNGLHLYQWNGKQSSSGERMKAAQLARAIDSERKGLPTIHVVEEGEKSAEANQFWDLLGGEGPVASAAEGGSDIEQEKKSEKRLFQLSDESGALTFTEIGQGAAVQRSLLNSNDVFVLDNGAEVFAWIGKGSSAQEKHGALQYAHEYLKKYNRPITLPISRILEGAENKVFSISMSA